MKKLLIMTLIFLTATIAFAQNNYQDVVYLKSGNIIRGMIIEQIPNESLKIETADGNLFVFKIDEIAKITNEIPVKAGIAKSRRSVEGKAMLEINKVNSKQISTIADLATINNDAGSLKGNYLLMNDLTVENWTPIGTRENPFLGTLDGNGHTITILSFRMDPINSQNTSDKKSGSFGDKKTNLLGESGTVSVGLFGTTGKGSLIINLRVTGKLTYDSGVRTLYMGAIAGENGGAIRSCVSTANINARGGHYSRSSGFGQMILPALLSGQQNVITAYQDEACGGGIAGVNKNLIENCYATGQVTVSGEGFKNAGGIAGRNGFGDVNSGNIKQCYATGNIVAKEDAASRLAGGITGMCMPGNIINSIALNEKLETIGNRKGITVAGGGVGYPANLAFGVTADNVRGEMKNAYFRNDMVIYMEKDDESEKKAKTGKKTFYSNRGKEIDFTLTQQQNWWMNDQSGVIFPFGTDENVPWVWDSELKRPVLFWETTEGQAKLDNVVQ